MDHPFEWISSDGLEVYPAAKHHYQSDSQRLAKESGFYDVKMFSHLSSTFDPRYRKAPKPLAGGLKFA